MMFRNTAVVAAAIGILAVFAMSQVNALPKGTKGCTAEQLQTPGAQACIDKMEDDIKNGRSSTHFVSCDLATGQIDCCAPTGNNSWDCSPAQASGIRFPPKAPIAGNTGTMAPAAPMSPKAGGVKPPISGAPTMQMTTEPKSYNPGNGKIERQGSKTQ